MPALTFATQLLSILATILLPGILFIVALKRGWWRALELPIDRGLRFAGEPLFGPSKTWLGVLVYGGGAAIVATVWSATVWSAPVFSAWVAPIFRVSPAVALLVGLTIGLAYAAAELANSFVKRRLRLESSTVTTSRWRPVQSFFDLADGILAVLLVLILWGTDAVLAVCAAAVGYLAHALTDAWMRRLRLKRRS